MGIQLTAFSGHRPRYVGRPAVLISLALQQTVARKKATCPSAIDDHPKSEGPIFVSMTASELFIDGQFRTVSSVEPVTDAVTEQVLGEGPDASLGDIDEANRSARDTETLDYSAGVLRTGFQQSASFLRILSGLRT
jgi:hypothetical protein